MQGYFKGLAQNTFGGRGSSNASRRYASSTRSGPLHEDTGNASRRSGSQERDVAAKCVNCKRCSKRMKLIRPSCASIQRWCDICRVKHQVKKGRYACKDCNFEICLKCGENSLRENQRPQALVQPVGGDDPIDDDQLCIICLDEQNGAVLVPCGHNQVCKTCAMKIDSCPLCRSEIHVSLHDQMLRIHREGMELQSNGRSGLHDAAQTGDVRRLNEYLMSGVVVDLLTSQNRLTPLHFATAHGHTNAVSCLLEARASVNFKDGGHLTPLHNAAEGGHDVTVQLLLANGSDIHATDLQEMTALHWAARKGHEKVVLALIAARANINAKSGAGYTPLAMAEDWGTASMTRLLREHGGVRTFLD